MSTSIDTALEAEIIRFLAGPDNLHDLPEIVRRFRSSADDATIKATLLKLSFEGGLEITPEWKFRTATAAEVS